MHIFVFVGVLIIKVTPKPKQIFAIVIVFCFPIVFVFKIRLGFVFVNFGCELRVVHSYNRYKNSNRADKFIFICQLAVSLKINVIMSRSFPFIYKKFLFLKYWQRTFLSFTYLIQLYYCENSYCVIRKIASGWVFQYNFTIFYQKPIWRKLGFSFFR